MSNIDKKSKILTFIKDYYWIAVIPLFFYGFILSILSENDINQHETDTFGIIYNSLPITKQYSKRRYKYKFQFKNQTYYGSTITYKSDHIKIGGFYKIEFSNENPNHSRMVFSQEYLQELKFDDSGKATDTLYIAKNQELKNQMNDIIESYEYE